MTSSTTFNVANKSEFAKSHWVPAKAQIFITLDSQSLGNDLCKNSDYIISYQDIQEKMCFSLLQAKNNDVLFTSD